MLFTSKTRKLDDNMIISSLLKIITYLVVIFELFRLDLVHKILVSTQNSNWKKFDFEFQLETRTRLESKLRVQLAFTYSRSRVLTTRPRLSLFTNQT